MLYNQRGTTKQTRCNAPSIRTPSKVCVGTVIDAQPVRGCIELVFQ